jgi:hypothetical protein
MQRSLRVCFVMLTIAAGAVLAQEIQSRFGGGQARFTTLPANESAIVAAAGQVPTWSSSFSFNGQTFPFTMVGTAPSTGTPTVIPTAIIPLRFVFSDGTILDPTQPVCGGTNSAVFNAAKSPVFEAAPFSPGGTNVGTTQYVDAYQRANFWSIVQNKPNYHVLLTRPFVAPVQTINVPAGSGTVVNGPCAKIGHVSIFYFTLTLLSHLSGIPTNIFPIFLTYNTFFTEGSTCCVLGFHTAFGRSPNKLSLAVAAYNDAGVFSAPIQDIHALSHEVGEWMADPFINNIVPPWTGGQVTGCSPLLENGDPVTGTAFEVTMNGMTYHPEDLVFLSWFARETPSSAVNGWYTFLNSFASPPPVCP